ncbi:MAG: hypothetical protein ACSHW1_05110 [Yoonia sp.]|uniref:hypothetical protein n=1 Tax=Yoonia sp. TaxID=2212373 RepID=UPI003EF59DD8
MFKRLTTSFLAMLLALPVALVLSMHAAYAETTLVMAEEPGCIWCARWNAEIAPIYPKTPEGQAAPLRRVNISEPIPEDIAFARRVNFTPTFVLLVDGVERSRIEGYPAGDFFWGLLGQMLEKEGIVFEVKRGK